MATWPNFAKKHVIICLEALLLLLNFTGGYSSGKTHTADCCFIYPGFVSSYDVPNAKRPSSVKFSLHVAQRFLTPRQSRRMRMRLPDEIFMISCISAYGIFGSSLIRDSTLETFSGVTVVVIRPHRKSSSNVLSPDMNCLNHRKTVALDEIDPQNSVLNFESTLEKVFHGSSHNTS